MTPETATAASDPLAGWAFAVAIIALAIAAFDSYINWRNRQDSKTVQFVLTGAMRRRPGVPAGVGAEPLQVWTLHNAGQASIVNPQIRVIGDSEPWPDLYFTGAGVLGPLGHLQVVPIGDFPAPDFASGITGMFWEGRTAIITWKDSKGNAREATGTVSYSYV